MQRSMHRVVINSEWLLIVEWARAKNEIDESRSGQSIELLRWEELKEQRRNKQVEKQGQEYTEERENN